MICDLCGQSGAQVRRVAAQLWQGCDAVCDRECASGQLSALWRKLSHRRNTARDRAHQSPPACVGRGAVHRCGGVCIRCHQRGTPSVCGSMCAGLSRPAFRQSEQGANQGWARSRPADSLHSRPLDFSLEPTPLPVRSWLRLRLPLGVQRSSHPIGTPQNRRFQLANSGVGEPAVLHPHRHTAKLV